MTITLATLTQATPQDVFDQVAIHLLRQKARSAIQYIDEYGLRTFCAFRSDDGLMCAAGCLMSDDEMRLFEIQNDGGWYPACERTGIWKHFKLIYTLQELHDTSPIEAWPSELARIAKQYNLDTTVLREHTQKTRSTHQVPVAGGEPFERLVRARLSASSGTTSLA